MPNKHKINLTLHKIRHLAKTSKKENFMKKIFIAITATTLALALAGCGAEDANLTDLSNQLDNTAHTISSFETTNPAKISLQDSSTQTSRIANNARQAIIDEEYYKTDILAKTSQIKQSLSHNKTLTKGQSSALGDLIEDLKNYTTSAEDLQNELKGTIKSISSLKKDTNKNQEKLNAKLTKLANNANARASYYENILCTLDEIEDCIKLDSFQNETTTQNDIENKTNNNENKTQTNQSTKQLQNECENCEDEFANKTEEYQSRYNEFAKKRNIDTYGPTRRNIDTYGYNNRYMPYGTNPYSGAYNGQLIPNNPYAYGWNGHPYYNSNNFNRLAQPNATPYLPASTTTPEQPRLETYEKINSEKQLERLEEKTETKSNSESSCKDCNSQEVDNQQIVSSQAKIKEVSLAKEAKPLQKIRKFAPKSQKEDSNDQIIVAHQLAKI